MSVGMRNPRARDVPEMRCRENVQAQTRADLFQELGLELIGVFFASCEPQAFQGLFQDPSDGTAAENPIAVSMGFLGVATPIGWEESKKHLKYIREHGVLQFVRMYHRLKVPRAPSPLQLDRVVSGLQRRSKVRR